MSVRMYKILCSTRYLLLKAHSHYIALVRKCKIFWSTSQDLLAQIGSCMYVNSAERLVWKQPGAWSCIASKTGPHKNWKEKRCNGAGKERNNIKWRAVACVRFLSFYADCEAWTHPHECGIQARPEHAAYIHVSACFHIELQRNAISRCN